MVGPRPVVALLYAVTSLSLIWCRRAPLAVLAFIVTADSAVYLVFGAPEGLGSFLPVLIAFYAVGRYSEPGNVVFAAPLVFVGIAIHELTDPVYSFGGSDRSSMRCSRQAGRLGTPSGGVQWRMRPLLEAQQETAQAAVTAAWGSREGEEPFGRFDAVEVGHLDVEEDDVGLEFACGGDRLCAVCCFADDFEVAFVLDDRPQSVADDCLVVGDEDPDQRAHGREGNRARTRNPPSWRCPASRSPP